jgi:hypothetical protein
VNIQSKRVGIQEKPEVELNGLLKLIAEQRSAAFSDHRTVAAASSSSGLTDRSKKVFPFKL